MNFKNIIPFLALLAFGSIATLLPAADNGNGTQTADTGVVPQLDVCRWATTPLVTASGTQTQTTFTNVLKTSSSILGDVVIVPGTIGDTVRIFNATSGAGCSKSTEVFYYSYGFTILGASTNAPAEVGKPILFPGGNGKSATSGLVAITTLGVTNTALRAFVNYDSALTRPSN